MTTLLSSLIAFLGMIGTPQIIIIVVVILLLFGGKKIPELMRGLGRGIKEFKNASAEDDTAEKPDAPEAPKNTDTPKK